MLSILTSVDVRAVTPLTLRENAGGPELERTAKYATVEANTLSRLTQAPYLLPDVVRTLEAIRAHRRQQLVEVSLASLLPPSLEA